MKTNLEDLDEDMNISHKVFRGLIAIGLHTNGIRKYFNFLQCTSITYSETTVAIIGIFPIGFKETQSIIFGLQAVLTSLYHAALGAYIDRPQRPRPVFKFDRCG